MLGRFFRGGKVRPGFFFPRGKIYTGILFPGAILSRGGFSGGKFYAGGNSMLQHRVVSLIGQSVSTRPLRLLAASNFESSYMILLGPWKQNSTHHL